MSILGLILLIVIICLVIRYVAMPDPLPLILRIVAVVLGILLLIIVLQAIGLLPPILWHPARIQ